MKAIAVFNNKGGVGKTTLLCNLAAHLALRKQYRVLVIDADPQCNATQSLFEDDVVDGIYENDEFTVDTVIRPLAQGKGFSSSLTPRHSQSFGVDVIPGDPRLALTEDLLATDWVQAVGGNTRGLRTSFVFSNLLEKCADYDLVLFDMGPSLGAINRAVLLSTDYFVLPMSIDIFSLRAMENISRSVHKWKNQLESGVENNHEPEELEVSDPRWKLQFAGYVSQQYTAKRDATGTRRPVKAYEELMRKIPVSIEANFVDATRSDGLTAAEYNLGTIPNLHSLIPMSQSSRKPIFELKGSDGVVGAHFQKVKEYEVIISEVSSNLIANIDRL
ncbi:ParA family protein [Gulosibacter sediminis]|uniref:ParA family protein n=1 Tax=Gulosibacter sediminis TaxID=1729695 RepID=UPI0024A8961D|nr:ParA family protein [Gulosibacter sediminis]